MRTPIRNWAVMILSLLVLSVGCAGAGGDEKSAASEASSGGLFTSAKYSVPTNTAVQVRLSTNVVSDSATIGQPVTGEVVSDVVAGGHVVIPAGSQVSGTVTSVKPAKRFGGQAMVAVGFQSVRLPNGHKVPVEGGMAAYADKQKAKDTGAIVGGTVGGAILGRVIGKDTRGAVTGAVIGGGIGTAIASRKGDEALLPAGTSATVQTTHAVELPAI